MKTLNTFITENISEANDITRMLLEIDNNKYLIELTEKEINKISDILSNLDNQNVNYTLSKPLVIKDMKTVKVVSSISKLKKLVL